jgi:alpha-tubulin suppressor-like RCC1 family protein
MNTESQPKPAALYVWGSNAFGQIGLENNNQDYSPEPIKLMLGLRIKEIACGGEHTIILTRSPFIQNLCHSTASATMPTDS